jgi:hypothetical protein
MSMAISVQCDCGRALRLKDHLAGKRVKCPDCSTPLNVPQPDHVEEEGFEILSQEPEAPPAARSQSYRSEYVAPQPPAAPPPPVVYPPKKKRKPSRPRSGGDRQRGGGLVISSGVITGLLMMVGAVVWFIVGLFAGWVFFYPPILFVIGLVRFIMGLMGHEED